MSSTFARSVTVLLLLSAGFSAGWWTRGLSDILPEGVSAPPSPEPQLSTEPRHQEPASGPTKVEIQADLAQPQPASSAHPAPAKPAPAEQDSRVQFQALLNAGEYDAAMNLYAEVERHSREKALSLKSDVLTRLETALREDNSDLITGLIDAFLSRYYDDIDVLLLLAHHQQTSGYFTEAAHTYQLAFTYAYNGAEQQQVQRAFTTFVGETDDFLSQQGHWQTLISLYETLALLELTQPVYRLRQAELYLNQDEPHYGRELLRRLATATEPAVATRAKVLLASAHPRPTPAPVSDVGDGLALNMTGSHYHLPLRLNDSVDVELIIDTGATTTTMSTSTFAAVRRQSRFIELGPQVFNTANGAIKGTVYRVERVQLGKHVLSDVHIAVLDFAMPPGIDGLLGMNILRNFRFQVDQDENRLYLRPRPE